MATANAADPNLPATQVNAGDVATTGEAPPAPETRTAKLLAMQERFGTLDRPKQLQLIVGVAASVVLVIAVLLWTLSQEDYKLLYGKLDTGQAAEISTFLQQEGVKYQLDKTTGEILVDPAQIHQIRMKLAAEGLPKQEGGGYEILEKEQGFGTSQFMEKARYHRALEGELARSVGNMESIDSARVHLAIPKQSAFVRDRREPSASVLVNLVPGMKLNEGHVAAIVHLVAASIPDLETENVTVVNQLGDMLSKDTLAGEMAMSTAQFDYKRKMEEYYVQRIERILMPIVGFEGVRAQVDANIDFSAIERTQESFNPDLPAVRSEHVVEEESRAGDTGGIPGALTNQPPGAALAPEVAAGMGAGAGGSPTRKSRNSTFNYELDRTISHTRSAPGNIQKLSVAVVVDDKVEFNSDGSSTRVPMTPEELDSLTRLVKEAVGFDLQRGDSLNVINASFQGAKDIPKPPEPPFWEQSWFFQLLKQGAGILLAVVLVMMLIRPVLRELKPKEEEIVEESLEQQESVQVMEAVRQGSASMGTLSSGLSNEEWERIGLTQEEYGQMLDVLRKTVTEDPRLVAQVVKTWVAADDLEEGGS
jgi:flagellar M-ring protein FliF